MKKLSAFLFLSTLALAACVDREDADTKLGMGCSAGIQAMLPENHVLKQLKSTNFAASPDLGAEYRMVKMQFADSDGFADADHEATCIFHEQFGYMNAGYTAQIYQLKIDEQVWGKQGEQIQGTYEENLKLQEHVNEALNQTPAQIESQAAGAVDAATQAVPPAAAQ